MKLCLGLCVWSNKGSFPYNSSSYFREFSSVTGCCLIESGRITSNSASFTLEFYDNVACKGSHDDENVQGFAIDTDDLKSFCNRNNILSNRVTRCEISKDFESMKCYGKYTLDVDILTDFCLNVASFIKKSCSTKEIVVHFVCVVLILIAAACIVKESSMNPVKMVPYTMILTSLVFNLFYINYKYYVNHEDNMSDILTIIIFCSYLLVSLIALCRVIATIYPTLCKFVKYSKVGIAIEIVSLLAFSAAVIFCNFEHRAVDILNGITYIPLLLCTILYKDLAYEAFFVVASYLLIVACTLYHSILFNVIIGLNDSDNCIAADIIVFVAIPIEIVFMMLFKRKVFKVKPCITEKKRVLKRSTAYVFEVNITENNEKCCICLDSQAKKESVKTPCNHYLHLFCITEWLKRNKHCPLCRANLPPLEE